jgi:hypothetical protein
MRPPLTKADLIAIRDRNKEPDVRALLWEIRRLRALVLRTSDMARLMDSTGGPAGILLESMRMTLKDEPIVLEQTKLSDF